MTALEIERKEESEAIRLRSAPDGRLIAHTERGLISVRVRQCFPWSEPHRHLSLRDSEDKEIALVDDPASLGEASRRALEDGVAGAGVSLEGARVVSVVGEVEV